MGVSAAYLYEPQCSWPGAEQRSHLDAWGVLRCDYCDAELDPVTGQPL